jgi:bifunctional DNA-binding transcriptional regulator/antitoxin component of YhaV-PrlF toxin-antitoxin module
MGFDMGRYVATERTRVDLRIVSETNVFETGSIDSVILIIFFLTRTILLWYNKTVNTVPHQSSTDSREFVSSVSPKGQITLPLPVRKLLGVKPKDKVAVRIEGKDVKIRKIVLSLETSFQAVEALPQPLNIEEMIVIATEEHAKEVAHQRR